MSKELNKKYNFKEVEVNKYTKWIDNGLFQPKPGAKKGMYTIVIPPPNITGKLHLGHAWDGTLQDILIRYKRLQGFSTMWIPGMDHAGIATQSKVEKRMREELGLTRKDYNKEVFLKNAWLWKEEYSKIIRQQWAKLGFALDYSKELFTLDDSINKYVNETFKKLYDKGLIYYGEKVINWDTKQQTAISNIEVIHEEKMGKMYYFKYMYKNSSDHLVVATTRPETMFGDVCVFVNPNDERYQKVIGKEVINPANGKIIPIMSDDYVDIEVGTGVMKCTPAHSFEDFDLGKKYNLEKIVCINLDGTMNSLANEFAGIDRIKCREQLVNKLTTNNLLVKIQDHKMSIGYSERSGEIIEPILSNQWFLSMKPLAQKSIEFQSTKDKINFVPQRFEKSFIRWMENIQDWCISRQLWWGHPIPVWRHKETSKIYVEVHPPTDIENWIQDPDVLDTWFSSSLWPISATIKQKMSERFPTDLLVSGYDIIFFWISRMIFQSIDDQNTKPFKDILIHGLIRDSQGKKMSKSLNNGIDPMDVIEQYGCDSLRFFLVTNSTPGTDIRYSEEKIRNAWNFINKLWNLTRFITINYESKIKEGDEKSHHKWIKNKFNIALKNTENYMEKYDFVGAGNELYSFVWNELCNTMVELIKQDLFIANKKGYSINLMIDMLKKVCIMLHPIIPFVTEEIYQQLPRTKGSIMNEIWPTAYQVDVSNDITPAIIKIISSIRNIRKNKQLSKKEEIRIQIESEIFNNDNFIEMKYLLTNENITLVSIAKTIARNEKIIESFPTFVLLIDASDVFDKAKEIIKLKEQLIIATSELERSKRIIHNEDFMNKANPEKINIEKEKYVKNLQLVEKIVESLQKLEN